MAGQGGPAQAQWHEHLARTLERMDGRWRTCMGGTHYPSTPEPWLATGPEGAADIDLRRDRFRPA